MIIASSNNHYKREFSDPVLVRPNFAQQDLFIISENIGTKRDDIVEVLSDQKKFLVFLDTQFYHLIADTIGQIFSELRKDPDILIVLDCRDLSESEDRYVSERAKVIELLDIANVKYAIVNSSRGGILMNNFYYYSQQDRSDWFRFKDVRDTFAKLVVGEVRDPYKKIYVSRTAAKGKEDRISSCQLHWNIAKETGTLQPGAIFEDDIRILDEELLENYLASHGFHIFRETDFENLFDQAKMFSEATVIMGATGAGLVNACFMRPETSLIEICSAMSNVSIDSGYWEFALHPNYVIIAMANDLNYFGISGMSRKAQDIIDRIENSPHLKRLISD
jgi:hypothetical protein